MALLCTGMSAYLQKRSNQRVSHLLMIHYVDIQDKRKSMAECSTCGEVQRAPLVPARIFGSTYKQDWCVYILISVITYGCRGQTRGRDDDRAPVECRVDTTRVQSSLQPTKCPADPKINIAWRARDNATQSLFCLTRNPRRP